MPTPHKHAALIKQWADDPNQTVWYASGKTGLADDMVWHLIDLADRTAEIKYLLALTAPNPATTRWHREASTRGFYCGRRMAASDLLHDADEVDFNEWLDFHDFQCGFCIDNPGARA
jgi:hypothetical protein